MTDDALAYLSGLEFFGMKLGLDNIRALVDGLGHPERSFRSIHIAGTNGKGSVTAMIDAALCAAGYRSARYTSPHLVDLTERCRDIAGAQVIVGSPNLGWKVVVQSFRRRAHQSRRSMQHTTRALTDIPSVSIKMDSLPSRRYS